MWWSFPLRVVIPCGKGVNMICIVGFVNGEFWLTHAIQTCLKTLLIRAMEAEQFGELMQ